MTTDEIEEEIDELKTSLDDGVKELALAKATYERDSDMKSPTLSITKMKYGGSDSAKKTLAEADSSYTDFLTGDKFNNALNFHTLDARRRGAMQRLEILRSLLSFNKTRTDQDV